MTAAPHLFALRASLAATLLAACAITPGTAWAQCSSSGPQALRALVERFTSADCQDCWTQPQSPLMPGPSALVVDWIVPGAQGDEAPLSAAALPEARARLLDIGWPAPAGSDIHVEDMAAGAAPSPRLRVAQGPPVSDYLGTIVQLPQPVRAATGTGPYRLSVVMVEALPAGDEGSPIARNVARNAFQTTWPITGTGPGQRQRKDWLEVRPMRIPDGTRPERLRVLAWVQDGAGRLVAAGQTRCE